MAYSIFPLVNYLVWLGLRGRVDSLDGENAAVLQRPEDRLAASKKRHLGEKFIWGKNAVGFLVCCVIACHISDNHVCAGTYFAWRGNGGTIRTMVTDSSFPYLRAMFCGASATDGGH